MPLTRRQLLVTGGMMAATQTIPSALAAPTPSINIGYASITWGGHDTEAIQDIASLGYKGIQLRANVLQLYPDPQQLADLLAQHNLTFVALSSGNADLDPAKERDIIAQHVAHATYLQKAGGKYLQLIGSGPANKTWTAADYKRQGELLTTIGERVAALGIQLGFHNHMGTIGQPPQATDAILDASDPRYVKLELDVAHYQQGGGDPAAAIKKYAGRLLFLHLKDVMPAPTANGYQFIELGQGKVNFPAIFKALRAAYFNGWGIVELDGERVGATRTPKESAAISKRYLAKLGLHI